MLKAKDINCSDEVVPLLFTNNIPKVFQLPGF